MEPTQKNTSMCEFLFEKEAHEIFDKRFPPDLVERCLNKMQNAAIELLKGRYLYLMDPAACNNQCQLYALMVSNIYAKYLKGSEDTMREFTQENRMILLSFLLSKYFTTNKKSLIQVVENLGISLEKKEKGFFHDPNGNRSRAAKLALNKLFRKYILETTEGTLNKLANEDLYMEPGKGRKNQKLYTLPKFIGVKIMLEQKFLSVIKIKVISKEGTKSLTFVCLDGERYIPLEEVKEGIIPPGTPMVVFEGVSAEKSYSMENFYQDRQKCPRSFYARRKGVHDLKGRCILCKDGPVPEAEGGEGNIPESCNEY